MGKQSMGNDSRDLTTGVRFTMDGLSELVSKFGSQEEAIEKYKEDYRDWIESSRHINVKSMEARPKVGEMFVIIETDRDTLRELGYDSLTKSAMSHWGYFLEKNDIETVGPNTVMNSFVSCDPDVEPEKQLLSA